MNDREPTSVLVIDSDTVRRGMLACTLPPGAYVLVFAKSAEAGLDLLGRQLPEVVLIGLDATTADLCQRIRLLPAGDACLLLLMDERLGEPGEAAVAGADAELPFPFDLEVLEELLRRHRQRPAAGATQLPRPPAERPASAPPGPVAAPPAGPMAAAEEPAPCDESAWAGFRERIDYLHDNLAGLDYFQLLDVPRGASLAQIKDAYFQRSMVFHPDRFLRLEDQELKAKNYEVYKRMTEAFRVLTQPRVRAAYIQDDLDVPAGARSVRYTGPGEPADAASVWCQAATPTGCRYLRFAELAYEAGNLRSAKKYLSLAADREPTNEELRRKLEAISDELDRESP